MNNENTKKELLEKIMDKAVLAGVLGIVAFVVTAKAMRFITHSKMVTMLFLIGSVIGVYTVFRKIYRTKQSGSSKAKGFFKGMLLLIPVWGFSVSILTCALIGAKYSVSMTFVVSVFVSALEAGVCEEIVCRGLFVGNAMRNKRNTEHIMKYAIVSSVCFGLVHFENLLMGAGFYETVSQVIYATGLGLIFCSVYYRTGSILPTIVTHFMVDFSAFMAKGLLLGTSENVELMTDNGSVASVLGKGVIIFAIGLGYSMFLLRKKKRVQIRERLVLA